MTSPLRRSVGGKSIGGKSLAGLSPLSPANGAFRANNDELEKQARRKAFAEQQARETQENSPYKTGVKRATAEKTRDQISEVYANCIKLCTENKINQKNTWQLPLIDYMEDVMQVQPGEMTNFQMASCTLDASVKIYSCRVDSIHSEAYKVLGGIGGSEMIPEEAEDGEGGTPSGEGGESTEEGKGKMKKRRAAVNTLETNPAALNVKKFDLEVDVDPLFKQMTASIDEGGARGLLLNALCTRNDAALIFDSQDTMTTGDKAAPTSDAASVSACEQLIAQMSATLKSVYASDAKICPSLHNFTFMGWVPVNEPQDATAAAAPLFTAPSSSTTTTKGKASAVTLAPALDVNMDTDGYFGGIDSDDEGERGSTTTTVAPANDMPDIDVGDFDAPTEVATSSQRVKVPVGLTLAVGSGDSEYTYFADKHLQHWVGPSHWKFQRKAADPATEVQKTAGGRRKKERFLLDFFGEEFDASTAFAKSRAATTLAKATLTKGASENVLPEDTHFDLSRLQRLFTMPKVKVGFSRAAAEVSNSMGQAWYDYNNPNDVQNYCAPTEAIAGMDEDDDDGLGGGMGDDHGDQGDMDAPVAGEGASPASTATTTGTLGENGEVMLVAQPRKIEKIQIDYAKHAKRVNVRQLKESMWGELVVEEKSSSRKPSVALDAKAAIVGDHHFSQVVAAVPQKVPAATAQNLSVPIMFVCLLHLANEKHLKITGVDNISDLHICPG